MLGGALNLSHMHKSGLARMQIPHLPALLHPFNLQLHQLITLWLAVQHEDNTGLINLHRICTVISKVLR